jgi:hypothetical protein
MSKECEICWAGKEGYDEEVFLYRYKGSYYCEQDLESVKKSEVDDA